MIETIIPSTIQAEAFCRFSLSRTGEKGFLKSRIVQIFRLVSIFHLFSLQ